ncbi:hypothetical protein [Paractinoplanes rishiriensis]|uniref:Integral membrane protein n=1 Tax=Paractinoplanes rishiriensis TaxID=1050105 RepID=A0A919K873_9ACTN|nr:hypothetical protein [Actinoplanes rishiriensis]GIF00543.1 hypothetical protein Ari01nite_80070 [Actinoplanes rishiriensis]
MSQTAWHLPDDQLRQYAGLALSPPGLWSVETHLAGCAACRGRLDAVAGSTIARAGWFRMETELDAPVPGPVERLLVRLGVPDHTARLLAAVPALRLSWLAAVALTLGLTAVVAWLSGPMVLLVIAPLLPLLGVSVSFGPRVDPTYEIALVAPMHTGHLLMIRCAAVLCTTTVLSGMASLALPKYGLIVLGWFLPALTLTLVSLVLTPRLGPVAAAGTVGTVWLLLVAVTLLAGVGDVAFAVAAQFSLALAGVPAAVAIIRLRATFERMP